MYVLNEDKINLRKLADLLVMTKILLIL